MNIKKALMMLTIMLITILSASSFYVLTGEATLNKDILVNATKTQDGDYEKVYVDDENAPYTETNGKYKGQKYYIRYTGAVSGRAVVDLEDTDVKDKDGNSVGGCGVTKESDGTIKIFKQTIKTTYKMFSYRNDKDAVNTEVTRIFIPSSIAIENDGIAANTFEGYNNNEIDCIYRTGDITKERKLANGKKILAQTRNARGSGIVADYDKTSKINRTSYPNIITYVCLDNKNMNREGITAGYDNAYDGKINNVFVSNSLTNWNFLFAITGDSPKVTNTEMSNDTIQYALLDDGSTWTVNQSIAYMFKNQEKLNISKHFRLPDSQYVTDMSYTFYQCLGITEFPSGFTVPKNVKIMNFTFDSMRNLKSFPNSFTLPNTVIEMGFTFSSCYQLKKFPDNFIFPNSVKKMIGTFNAMYLLEDIITIPGSVDDLENLFTSAGINANNIVGYDTPIVMKYYTSNEVSNSYATNVLTTSSNTKNNKVTKVPIVNQSGWVKEEDNDNGTYSDDNGSSKFYLHYTGSASTVYLGRDFPLTSDGYPTILSTRVYNTYKMFANNQTISRVFVPASIAINANGIESNTFDGCTSQKAIDLIYHTGNVLTGEAYKDARAIGLSLDLEKYDKTDVFPSNSNAKAYVYLGDENIKRTIEHIATASNSSTYDINYQGGIKNVYLSQEVNYPGCFFDVNPWNSVPSKTTLLDYALIDNEGTRWMDNNMNIWALFYCQSNLQLTDNFDLPSSIFNGSDSVYGWGLRSFFAFCTSIDKLPSKFHLPTNVSDISDMFARCYKLSGTIFIPDSVENMVDSFLDSGRDLENTVEGGTTITPIVIEYDSSSGAASYTQNVFNPATNPSGKVTKIKTKTYQEANNSMATVAQISTDKVMIEDCTDEISVTVNKVNSSEKTVIEVETELTTITVHKKSDGDKSEDDEVQE